jgi:hypothetical protein
MIAEVTVDPRRGHCRRASQGAVDASELITPEPLCNPPTDQSEAHKRECANAEDQAVVERPLCLGVDQVRIGGNCVDAPHRSLVCAVSAAKLQFGKRLQRSASAVHPGSDIAMPPPAFT